MNRRIEFNAGYYEWNILINGECIYSFGDLTEFFETGDTVEEVVEILLDAMMEYFKAEGKEYPLNNEETEFLSELVVDKLYYQYVA